MSAESRPDVFQPTIAALAATREIVQDLLAEDGVRDYLSKLHAHHQESWEHSLRVGHLAADLGVLDRLERQEWRLLACAGLLHDIGKLRIPQEVLLRVGLLDPESREVMREHSRLGFEFLGDLVPITVRRIVVAHHEFCRDPYPRGATAAGTVDGQPERRETDLRILRLAEMVAVADMFDALIHRRSYKPALSRAETERLLSQEFTGDARYVEEILERCAGPDE